MELKHRFKKDQRVRLKSDGQDSFYELAQSGSEGWIKSLGFDEVGWPMVFIHWDTEHWTYNGEEDMVTFEDHFELVEEETMSEEPEINEDQKVISWLAKKLGLDENDIRNEYHEDLFKKEGSLTHAEAFDQALDSGYDDASDSEAFLILTVNADPNDENGIALHPKIYQGAHSQTSALLLQSLLSAIAADAHEEITSILINQINKYPEKYGGK